MEARRERAVTAGIRRKSAGRQRRRRRPRHKCNLGAEPLDATDHDRERGRDAGGDHRRRAAPQQRGVRHSRRLGAQPRR